ncbi:uncharacterized protein IL334_003755 [Kwoniella shivajii]|uniref:Haloacid dehalogenase, type II n=1 Tax=Kwoniella shivajii TaxID=564305 RepID=A0ABZ1D2I4_9TREE|nr:hypothetical protein IL334_003755 [Kwoniella shivajii]
MPLAFFDIVGTCFGYDALEDAVDTRLGAKLVKYGVSSKLFAQFWLVTLERDASFMQLTQRPKMPYEERWAEVLPRCLYQAGVTPEDIDTLWSPDDVQYIVHEYLWKLRPRPGFAEMLEILEKGGIQFWCCSSASVDRVKAYFKLAGIDFPVERIWDATPVGASKPQPAVYERVMKDFGEEGRPLIFGASHAWDCAGAKNAGFRTAYTTVYEKYECVTMWGQHDIVEPDLISLGKSIVEKYGTK